MGRVGHRRGLRVAVGQGLGPQQCGQCAEVVPAGDDERVTGRGRLCRQLSRVDVRLILAGLGPGQGGAGQQPDHPGGIGLDDGKLRDAAAAQRTGDAAGLVEELAVGRGAFRRDDCGATRCLGRGRLE